MPTLPSVNHSRDDSLPQVPNPSGKFHPRAAVSSAPTTDPLTYPSTFTGSVVGSISRRNRRSFAVLAQKTSSAFASLSTIGQTTSPGLHPSASSNSLSKNVKPSGISSLTPPLSDKDINERLPDFSRPVSPAVADPLPALKRRLTLQRIPTSPKEPRLAPAPTPLSKMHQTSSRLLRMTEDERPFTKVSCVEIGCFRTRQGYIWKLIRISFVCW